MRIFLLLILLALPAGAETFNCIGPCTVTITPGSVPATCAPPQPASSTSACPAGQSGAITTSYSCVGMAWTQTTVSACSPASSCAGLTPTTNYEARASLGNAITIQTHSGRNGVTYSYPLPATATGKGLLVTTLTPTTPGGILVQLAISQCPGDMTYYQTAAAQYMQFGSMQVPCGGIFNTESGGLKWSPTMSSFDTYCIVQTTTNPHWYINVRYTAGCDAGASCPIYYTWQPTN